MVRSKITPRKTVRPAGRPPPEYRLYWGYIYIQGYDPDYYVQDLAHMRDRVLRTGYHMSDYEAFVHLLQTIVTQNGKILILTRIYRDFLEKIKLNIKSRIFNFSRVIRIYREKFLLFMENCKFFIFPQKLLTQ